MAKNRKTREQFEARRLAAAEEAQTSLFPLFRRLQQAAYTAVLEWLFDFDTDDEGRLIYNVKSLRRVEGVFRVFGTFGKTASDALLAASLERAEGLINLNGSYFGSFAEISAEVATAARREALLAWGYDLTKGQLLSGGYLSKMFNNDEVARSVAALVNQALANKTTLADFRRTFAGIFVGKPGGGMLERHYRTVTFDLFQALDRSANLAYADQLGLNFAVYSGTLMVDSRPFCVAIVNKCLSRGEIEEAGATEWKGKKPFNNIYTDCGGFNCRHHWSFVSDELANHLRKK